MMKRIMVFIFFSAVFCKATIFDVYPRLSSSIPFISLGTFPTPVQKLNLLSKYNNQFDIYIKRDDLSGGYVDDKKLFGGNKVRKLEFLLADALQKQTKGVLTFGCIGSNHVVATSSYAHMLGLETIAMLKPQPLSHVVRRNLLLMQHNKAYMYLSVNNRERNYLAEKVSKEYEKINSSAPYIIPTGGSCPLGILGFVNAAFELKYQIDQGIMPEPDAIFVPFGSGGTTVGLLLGLKAAKMNSKVIAICVEPMKKEHVFEKIKNIYEETNNLLKKMDNSFPLCQLEQNDFNIITDFSGLRYGLFTQQAVYAIKRMHKYEHILLDGTYSGKAFAALLDYLDNNASKKKETVLFWNTYYPDSFKNIIDFNRYKNLKECFWHYFEDLVQPLDVFTL